MTSTYIITYKNMYFQLKITIFLIYSLILKTNIVYIYNRKKYVNLIYIIFDFIAENI